MNTDFIKAMLVENPRYSVQDIMDATNISKKTVYNHLIKIGYVNRWVFRFHTNGDRLYEPRIYMRFFFQRHERNPFLKRLVTGDEIWILYQNVHR